LVLFDQGARGALHLGGAVVESLCWDGQGGVALHGLENAALLSGLGRAWDVVGDFNAAHFAVVSCVSLLGGWLGVGHAVAFVLGDELRCEVGALVVDAVDCSF
jgi:hypothetical protein